MIKQIMKSNTQKPAQPTGTGQLDQPGLSPMLEPNQAFREVRVTQYQSIEEIQELLLQELENVFDRPCLIPVHQAPSPQMGADNNSGQSKSPSIGPTPFKVGIEKDYSNTFLITNPMAIFRVFGRDQFLSLPESTQCILLDRLDDILAKCSHNVLVLTDHVAQASPSSIIRICQTAIFNLKAKQRSASLQLPESGADTKAKLQRQNQPHSGEQDLIYVVIHLALKMSTKSQAVAKRLLDLLKKLTSGKRFYRCHIEFLYQYLKVKCAKLSLQGKAPNALEKVHMSLKMLQSMFEQRYDPGPANFFYFSGYLSGIQVNTKMLPQGEFQKGFTAALWFQIHESSLQDDKNLPVLFSCFLSGFGGFECYFNKKKLFYRILPKVYTSPTVESNGVPIGEFSPKKWYFFAIEHERPFMTRPQITVIINDKQVIQLPMDYPKIDKTAKISMLVICQNMIGQLSSFLLFKDAIGNSKKLIQMGQTAYENGIYQHAQLANLRTDIIDPKMIDKLLLLYSPDRTSNKTVYDCVEMRDGELMINSGVCNSGPKGKLSHTGGIQSLLPFIELIRAIASLSGDSVEHKLADLINEYLRLLIIVLQSRSLAPQASESNQTANTFFSVLFHLLAKLPPRSAVSSQTIQNLADIRFHIGEASKTQEQFFLSLMMSSDFWINTDNMEVINEFWSFVKAIYQQNPIAYNRIFGIQNLIDLMVKISENKDSNCCKFHKETFMIFYQGQQSSPTELEKVPMKHQDSLWVMVEKERPAALCSDEDLKNESPFKNEVEQGKSVLAAKIQDIDKYLQPIAGVLEGVLTCGGNEVLDQIQYIAKALTMKTSSCFHLQMLKLLKVLLLDSKEDRHCASPADFAHHFLKAKGLQILLQLCSHSSFDVKAMCVKLLDVLTAHANLIKVAFDPDVITYLCNIILPKQMMDTASTLHRKNQLFSKLDDNIPNQLPISEPIKMLQYVQAGEDPAVGEEEEGQESDDQDDLENQMNLLLAKKPPLIQKKNVKKEMSFGDGLFLQNDDDQKMTSPKQKHGLIDQEAELMSAHPMGQGRFKRGLQQDQPDSIVGLAEKMSLDQDVKVEDLLRDTNFDEADLILASARPPPPAPKNRHVASMKFDFDSEESSSVSEVKFNQTSKNNFFFGRSKHSIITEAAENEEDEEDDEPMVEDRSLKGFEDTENDQLVLPSNPREKFSSSKQFMNTQKIPSSRGSGGSGGATGSRQMAGFLKKKGLALAIEEDQKPSGLQLGGPKKKFGKLQLEDNDSTLDPPVSFIPPQPLPTSKFGKSQSSIFKGDDPNNFSNENVMSKSNLRQPKSFNFGFPDLGSSDDEEAQGSEQAQSITEEEEKSVALAPSGKKAATFQAPSLGRKRPLLSIGDDDSNPVSSLQIKQDDLIIAGTTGATSDEYQNEKIDLLLAPQSSGINGEREDEEDLVSTPILNHPQALKQNKSTKRQSAVISYQKKAKLFTNANQKLNIDTDAINELFNYGGEKGQIMMSEDEEMKQLESEIEELASMCIAAMNRKRPSDPIKYENKREKSSFESKFLLGQEEKGAQGKKENSKKQKNPRKQFMTPQSVRGIKKIEFSLSHEERNAALENQDQLLGASFGNSESVLSGSGKQFTGLKSGLFTSNTILEEISVGEEEESSNKSSSCNIKQSTTEDIHFTGLLSSSGGDQFIIERPLAAGEPKILINERKDSLEEDALMKAGEDGIPSQLQNEQMAVFSDTTLGLNQDQYNQQIENLYTSCLEWIISRAPSSLNENIVIDECDKVGYQPAIQLLLTLVTYSNNSIRQKALTDFEMLSNMDSSNGIQIMMHPHFHTWLLELLMPYQELASKYPHIQGSGQAVFDIGSKLHTLLLKNACTNSEEEAYKKINFVSRWPSIIQLQCNLGIKDRTEQDVETAQKLSRVLLQSLINSLRDEIVRNRSPIKSSPAWHNLVYISYMAGELIFGSHGNRDLLSLIESGSDQVESSRDFKGQSLFKWVNDEGYLLYYYGSNEKSLWAEWDLIESLFSSVDCLYPEWSLKALKATIDNCEGSYVENIFNLLEKATQADELNQIMEILVQDPSPYKAQQSPYLQQQPPKQHSKKGILGNVLAGHFKLPGSSSSSSNNNQQAQNQSQELQAQQLYPKGGEQSFMWNTLNIICIALTQSDTKQAIQLWLDRLEKFVKLMMLVSESWRSKNVSSLFNSYQRKFIESITFALAFIFHEIHAKNRSSPIPSSASTTTAGFNASQTLASSVSPKDQMLFNKLYAQTFKNIFTFFSNIIEYSRIKYTPAQLETHVTACRYIFNNLLVKSHLPGQEAEKLITFGDLARFKRSEFEEFPEHFYHNEWKVTFFNNESIRRIVKANLNLETLALFLSKRNSYSQNHLDTQASNEKTKDEILRRMQRETIEEVAQVQIEEYDRRNKVALLNDDFIRLSGKSWRQVRKDQIGARGMWKGDPSRLKMSWHKLTDGTRPVMQECFGPSKFQYFENQEALEKKIFHTDPATDSASTLDILLIDQYRYRMSDLQSDKKVQERKRLTLHGIEQEDGSTPKRNEEEEKFTGAFPKHSWGIQSSFQNNNYKAHANDLEDVAEEHCPFDVDTKQLQKSEKSKAVVRPSAPAVLESKQHNSGIVSFFSRMLSDKDKTALKKQYVSILKSKLNLASMLESQRTGAVKFKEIIEDMRCEILKPFYKRTGIVTLTSYDILFFDDLEHSLLPQTTQQSTSDNIFFFKHKTKPDTPLYKVIHLQDLREIQRRRWLGRKSALEIFLMNGKSLLLNFINTDDREQFAKKIIRQRNSKSSNLKYYDTLEPRRILKKRELTERWMQWRLSNFEYITLLNQLAGRSYNDLSQYPVFPWIFVDYSSQSPPDIHAVHNSPMGPLNGFRDLNKNMQLLGSAERQAEFKRKFEDEDSFETLQERFHCGSHYSNPGIVLHYLSRVSPYLDALVQLHGKSLDTPDRGFHSVQDSLNSALNDYADVRELIPEFFYCPEMFVNQNRVNFGVKQDGVTVNDVQLPPWCQNDPYQFVMYLREAFESHYVSQNLGSWVDYIFGCKQRDQDAERCLNTYSRLTYEDGVDLDGVPDPIQRQSYQEQIYNYGQTPSQLFQKQQKHPTRLPRQQALKFNTVVDMQSKIKVYKPVTVQQAAAQQKGAQVPSQQVVLISQEAILRAKFVDDQMIVGLSKDGSVTYFFWLSKAHELNPNTPFTLCEDKKRKFDNKTRLHGLDFYDRSIKRYDFPLLILNHQKCVFRGGFCGGKISICPIEGLNNEPQTVLTAHQATVTALVCTANERVVISGSKAGDVIVWTFQPLGHSGTGQAISGSSQHSSSESNWQIRKHIFDHEAMVNFLQISEEMNMYLSCSFDGSVHIYNLWTDSHIKQFQHPKLSPIHSAVLTSTPLSACCFFSREDHHWYSYALNNSGQMLEKQREECSHIIAPQVVKDSHFMDRLVYGTEKGYLIFRQLPMLRQLKKQQVSTSFPVLSIVVSPDRRFLLVGCGDGGLNVVTEPLQAMLSAGTSVSGGNSGVNAYASPQITSGSFTSPSLGANTTQLSAARPSLMTLGNSAGVGNSTATRGANVFSERNASGGGSSANYRE